jgi:K+ transporter
MNTAAVILAVAGSYSTVAPYGYKIMMHGVEHPTYGTFVGAASLLVLMASMFALYYFGFIIPKLGNGESSVVALYKKAITKYQNLAFMLTIFMLYCVAVTNVDVSGTGAITYLSLAENLQQKFPWINTKVFASCMVFIVYFICMRSSASRIIKWGGMMLGPVWVFALVYPIFGVPKSIILDVLSMKYILYYITNHPIGAIFTIGAAILIITGKEAFLNDLGHYAMRNTVTMGIILMIANCSNVISQAHWATTHEYIESAFNPFNDMYMSKATIVNSIGMIVAMFAVAGIANGVFSQWWQTTSIRLTKFHAPIFPKGIMESMVYVFHLRALSILTVVFIWWYKTSSALEVAYSFDVMMCITLGAIIAFFTLEKAMHKAISLVFVSVFSIITGIACYKAFSGVFWNFEHGVSETLGGLPTSFTVWCIFASLVIFWLGQRKIGDFQIFIPIQSLCDLKRDEKASKLTIFSKSIGEDIEEAVLRYLKSKRFSALDLIHIEFVDRNSVKPEPIIKVICENVVHTTLYIAPGEKVETRKNHFVSLRKTGWFPTIWQIFFFVKGDQAEEFAEKLGVADDATYIYQKVRYDKKNWALVRFFFSK